MRRPIFLILGILLLVILVVFIFRRGSDEPIPVGEAQKVLHDYANSEATVSLTTQGRLVGDDKYRSVRVTVGRDFRRVEVLAGYNGIVEKSQDFSNNQTAYDAFLRALEQRGFTKERKAATPDERGACATGNRYVYELKENGDQLQRAWSTSCDAGQGTFAGNQVIRQLFQAQITDYGKFISGVSLL